MKSHKSIEREMDIIFLIVNNLANTLQKLCWFLESFIKLLLAHTHTHAQIIAILCCVVADT